MFPSGSAKMEPRTEALIRRIAAVIQKMPNRISITGHTDAMPFRTQTGYGNWELSADRANASRRALIDAGLDPQRIAYVTGKADTEPLIPEDPSLANNRRISIVLLRDAPGAPPAPPADG
jgi:chemotaxis protein MotB